MTDEDWQSGFVRCLGLRLAGDAIEETDAKGQPITDDTFLLILNAHNASLPFTLPANRAGVRWERVFDTAHPDEKETLLKGGVSYDVEGRSLVLLALL